MTKEQLSKIEGREVLLLKRLNFYKVPFSFFMQDLYTMWLCASLEDSDDVFIQNFDQLLEELQRCNDER